MAREGSETAAQGEGSLWQDKPVAVASEAAHARWHAPERRRVSGNAQTPAVRAQRLRLFSSERAQVHCGGGVKSSGPQNSFIHSFIHWGGGHHHTPVTLAFTIY